MTPSAAPARSARLDAAFAEEEYAGLRLAARVRALALVALTAWVTVENPFPYVFYIYGYLALFALLGFGPLLLRRAGRYGSWGRYLFPTLDVTLLSILVFVSSPLDGVTLPPQMVLRFGNEMYLFIFIAQAAFTYSPGVVLWTGVYAALLWSAITLRILLLPDTVYLLSPDAWRAFSAEQMVAAMLDPRRVNLGLWGRQVLLFTMTAAILATFVRRARRLVARQADVARERANLSRYFSPNLVDELAQADEPLGPTRQQDVAVLFVDLVGFTGLAETLPPAAVIDLLRAHHARMERLVFAHGGTVDKYIGDALMATFGTPRPGDADATRALRCARAMLDALQAWNAERARDGAPALAAGIGADYGPVVLGDIGGEARLEYAVIGDTVNVASRLERLTRSVGAPVIVSAALVAAARREAAPDLDALLAGFAAGPAQALRGRGAAVDVFVLRPAE